MKRTWLLALPLPALGLAAVLGTYQGWPSAAVAAVVAVTGAVAVLILRSHPAHRIGWLLAVHSLLVAVIAPGRPPVSRGDLVLAQLLQGSWLLMLVCPVLIAYLFPDGHVLSRRWGWWMVAVLCGYALFLVAAATDRNGFVESFPGQQPPLPTLEAPVVNVLGLVALAFVPASLVGAVVAARSRQQRRGVGSGCRCGGSP